MSAHKVAIDLLGLAIVVYCDDAGRMLRFQQQQGDVLVELQGQ